MVLDRALRQEEQKQLVVSSIGKHRVTTRSKKVVGIQGNQGAFCAILEDGDALPYNFFLPAGRWFM